MAQMLPFLCPSRLVLFSFLFVSEKPQFPLSTLLSFSFERSLWYSPLVLGLHSNKRLGQSPFLYETIYAFKLLPWSSSIIQPRIDLNILFFPPIWRCRLLESLAEDLLFYS